MKMTPAEGATFSCVGTFPSALIFCLLVALLQSRFVVFQTSKCRTSWSHTCIFGRFWWWTILFLVFGRFRRISKNTRLRWFCFCFLCGLSQICGHTSVAWMCFQCCLCMFLLLYQMWLWPYRLLLPAGNGLPGGIPLVFGSYMLGCWVYWCCCFCSGFLCCGLRW